MDKRLIDADKLRDKARVGVNPIAYSELVEWIESGQLDPDPILLPTTDKTIELLSEKVHDAWQNEKISQGFHAPVNCQSENKRSYRDASWNEKERFDDHFDHRLYKWCEKCHTDLYPYSELEEHIKEYDRVTVRTVLKAIEEVSHD